MSTLIITQNFYSTPKPVPYYKYLVYKVIFVQIATMVALFCYPMNLDKFPSDMILVPLYINAAIIAKYLILMVGKIKCKVSVEMQDNYRIEEHDPLLSLATLSLIADVIVCFALLSLGHVDPDYGTEGLTPDTATLGIISSACSIYLTLKLIKIE